MWMRSMYVVGTLKICAVGKVKVVKIFYVKIRHILRSRHMIEYCGLGVTLCKSKTTNVYIEKVKLHVICAGY